MTYPAITALTTGVLVLIQMGLMFLTIKSRYKHKQGLGDGGHKELIACIRSHGNLAENAAIILIALGLLEMSGANQMLMAALGGTLVLARLLHPMGLFQTDGTSIPRFLGVVLTTLVALIAAISLISTAIERLS